MAYFFFQIRTKSAFRSLGIPPLSPCYHFESSIVWYAECVMAFAALPNLNSDSVISDTAENTDPKTSSGLPLTYNYDKIFENQGEGLRFVKGEKQFRLRNTMQSSNGNMSCIISVSVFIYNWIQHLKTSPFTGHIEHVM